MDGIFKGFKSTFTAEGMGAVLGVMLFFALLLAFANWDYLRLSEKLQGIGDDPAA